MHLYLYLTFVKECVYVCLQVPTYVCVTVYDCMYVRMHVYMYVCTYVCM